MKIHGSCKLEKNSKEIDPAWTTEPLEKTSKMKHTDETTCICYVSDNPLNNA